MVVKVPVKQAKAPAKKEAQPAPQAQPSKPAPVIYEPTVTFDEAADEIWPQLNNPTPIVEEKPATEQPVQEAIPVPQVNEQEQEPQPVGRKVKIKFKRYDGSEVVIYEGDKKKKAKPVSFEQAADEIWPQLNNPKPLPKEEAKPQPAPAKKQPKVEQAKPAPVVDQTPKKKIKVAFKRSDGTMAFIYKKDKESNKKPGK